MSAGVMEMGETQTENDPFQNSFRDTQSSVEIWETGTADERYVVTAQRVIELIESGSRPGDIAVLMRTKRHVDRIVQELARRGVQCLIQAEGQNYYLRSEIRDFSSLLKSVSDPTDDLALLCSLRSPFVGVSLDGIVLLAIARGDQPVINALEKAQLNAPDRARLDRFLRWFLPLSLHSEQLPAWRVLADIFAMTRCDARFGLMSGSHGLVANARKLLSLAIQKREMRASEFGKWLSKQTQLRSVSGDAQCISDDADAVRIVTIHKAKGLEWENVVAFIEPSWIREADMYTAPKELILAPKDCRAGDAMHVEGARASAEEDQRLLYVALTRAMRRLCIALPTSSKRGSELISEIRLRLMPKSQPVEGVLYKSLDVSDSLRN